MSLTLDQPERPDTVIYCEATKSIIDYVRPPETPQQAIQRLAEYGTALTPLHVDEAVKRIEDAFRTKPIEIDEETWNYALNVLPPVAWKHTADGESFKISERLTYSLTAIYVRMNERYFTFTDSIYTPHDECCRMVFESDAYKGSLEPRETPPPAREV